MKPSKIKYNSLNSDTANSNFILFGFDAIHKFSQEIFSYKSVDEIYWAITHELAPALNLVDCVVYEVDNINKQLIQKAAYGIKNPKGKALSNHVILNFDEGNAGVSASTGKSLIINDTSTSKNYIVDGFVNNSEIEVPIKFEDQVFAVLSSEHSEKNYFNQEHVQLLEIVGAIAIGAILKIKEREELKQIQTQLENVVKKKSNDLDLAIETLSNQFSELKLQNSKRKTLIQEIHHRVNNNLQIISSLLNLYISDSDNNTVKPLKEIHSRVETMALIHQNIYKSVEMNLVVVETYILDLVSYLKGHFSPKYLLFDINSEVSHLSLDTLVPLGLLINEMLSILIKNCFIEGQPSIEIAINVKKTAEDQTYILSLENNGNNDNLECWNIEDNLDINSILTSALIDQLEGSIEIETKNDNSVTVDVKFRNL